MGEQAQIEPASLSMQSDSTAVLASDEDLAHRATRGCSASFNELARRFQVPLVHFLERWAAPEDAEDLAQDTLIRAYRNLHRYRPRWPFSTWLFTIARRLSINHQRRRRPRLDSDAMEAVQDARGRPETLAAEAESRQRLWDLAREALSEPQFTATWLYYVEEMSVSQIARVLGRSKTATKVTLFRARKRLLPILQELEPSDAPEGCDPDRRR